MLWHCPPCPPFTESGLERVWQKLKSPLYTERHRDSSKAGPLLPSPNSQIPSTLPTPAPHPHMWFSYLLRNMYTFILTPTPTSTHPSSSRDPGEPMCLICFPLFDLFWFEIRFQDDPGYFSYSICCAGEGTCKAFLLSPGHAYFSKLVSIMLIPLISQTRLCGLCIQCLLSK